MRSGDRDYGLPLRVIQSMALEERPLIVTEAESVASWGRVM